MTITTDARGAQNPHTSLQIFQYEGSEITFKNADGSLMVNLTEMAKSFGKQPKDFLRIDQTKAFIEELEKSDRLISLSDSKSSVGIPIVVVKKGGREQGTWAHEKLALKFAAWLSPKFELWVYDRIKEILTTGSSRSEIQPGSTDHITPLINMIKQNVDIMYKMGVRIEKLEKKQVSKEQNPPDQKQIKSNSNKTILTPDEAMLDIVSRANHKGYTKYYGRDKKRFNIKHGQLAVFRGELEKAWGWHTTEVTALMSELMREEGLQLEQHGWLNIYTVPAHVYVFEV